MVEAVHISFQDGECVMLKIVKMSNNTKTFIEKLMKFEVSNKNATLLTTTRKVELFEYYDGLTVTTDSDEFLIEGDWECWGPALEYMFQNFWKLDNLKVLKHESRFASECSYENLIVGPNFEELWIINVKGLVIDSQKVNPQLKIHRGGDVELDGCENCIRRIARISQECDQKGYIGRIVTHPQEECDQSRPGDCEDQEYWTRVDPFDGFKTLSYTSI